jgi:hypothetical protein
MNRELAYLVSNNDIERKFTPDSRQIKILLYPELINIRSIMDILPEYICACFILLRTSQNSGHWTVICRNNTRIYYFDSYGVKPDGELSKIASDVRYELHENSKSLSRLIRTIPGAFKFSWNETQFQRYSPIINTCGRWCYVFARCVLNGMTLVQFVSRMDMLKHEYKKPYDDLVCLLWNII